LPRFTTIAGSIENIFNPGGSFGIDLILPGQGNVQYLFVEEEQGGERLFLGRSSDVAISGRVVEERGDFGRAHPTGVALLLGKDESAHPVKVGQFGAGAVMSAAHDVADRLCCRNHL
jgi:hypothetical protein